MGQEFANDSFVCSTGDPGNADQAAMIQDAFANTVQGAPSGHFAQLTPAQQVTARAVFGASLDFRSIQLSDFLGLGNRPFTITIAPPAVLGALGIATVSIINCGTFSPGTSLLIHELTHVWQSQHHQDPLQFMRNSAASQALAAGLNISAGSLDPLSPFSPYAYIPGKAFSAYAAEQIAEQVEGGEAPIVAHVASITMGARDADNEAGLAAARCEDTRVPGVHL